MLDMFEKGMQPEYVDFHKDGKTILYGDSNKCSGISLSKHLLPQCLVAYYNSNVCFLMLLQCRHSFLISIHYAYSPKIVAIFLVYKLCAMACHIKLIRNIIVAFKGNMSSSWLIEKIQILVWYKYLYHSMINDLTVSLYGYRIRYFVECDSEGKDYNSNDYSSQTDEARRNFAYHIPHLLTSQLYIHRD